MNRDGRPDGSEMISDIRWRILDPRLRGDDGTIYRLAFPRKRGAIICCRADNPVLLTV